MTLDSRSDQLTNFDIQSDTDLNNISSKQIVPYFGKTFTDEPLPKDGYVDLDPKRHGFGVTLNPELKLRRPSPHKPKAMLETKSPNQEEWLRSWRDIPAEC